MRGQCAHQIFDSGSGWQKNRLNRALFMCIWNSNKRPEILDIFFQSDRQLRMSCQEFIRRSDGNRLIRRNCCTIDHWTRTIH